MWFNRKRSSASPRTTHRCELLTYGYREPVAAQPLADVILAPVTPWLVPRDTLVRALAGEMHIALVFVPPRGGKSREKSGEFTIDSARVLARESTRGWHVRSRRLGSNAYLALAPMYENRNGKMTFVSQSNRF